MSNLSVRKGDEASNALERLVAFAEGDAGASRPILAAVIDAGHAVAVGDALSEIAQWKESTIQIARLKLRSFLRYLVAAGADDDRGTLVEEVDLGQLKVGATVAGRSVLLTIDGPARDVLWFQILDVLRTVGIDRLVACPACQRLFVRAGRKGHCSAKCGQVLRSRRFYDMNRGKVLEQRHIAYVRKRRVRQPKAKIRRRSRS